VLGQVLSALGLATARTVEPVKFTVDQLLWVVALLSGQLPSAFGALTQEGKVKRRRLLFRKLRY
jgi:hypothetical protein